MQLTDNLHIKQLRALASPNLIIDALPLTDTIAKTVKQARDEISHILNGDDDRLLVVVGPCSIHDPNAAMDYAKRLHAYAQQHQDTLCLVMRVYFEKPRTTIGWKGLINDPDLDGQFNINKGLRIARHLLLDINQLGLPTATEFLDTTIPQYIADLISWAAIGARTTESQIHRQLASGLSMPVGFKNGTTGNVQIAVDAVAAASHDHHFLGVTRDGVAAIVSTNGNPDCHVILRGSTQGPNYDTETISKTIKGLTAYQLHPRVMVDCSHGNSYKDHTRQRDVALTIAEGIRQNDRHVFGLMIESNLVAGKQALTDASTLTYGQSITDACIDWNETTGLLDQLADAVQCRRQHA